MLAAGDPVTLPTGIFLASKVYCVPNDPECGVYAQFVNAAGLSVDTFSPLRKKSEGEGYTREFQTGNDGWIFSVFRRKEDVFVAVEKEVVLDGHAYVFQAMKRQPASPKEHARYSFKLFKAGTNNVAARLYQGKDDRGHLFVAGALATFPTNEAMLIQNSLQELLQRYIIIDACYYIGRSPDHGSAPLGWVCAPQ